MFLALNSHDIFQISQNFTEEYAVRICRAFKGLTYIYSIARG